MRLDNIFSVNNQFQRSINVVSDFHDLRILDGYLLTPLCNRVTSRILEGIINDTNQSAWTITGPYGAGKSASLLFLMQLLGKPTSKQLLKKVTDYAPNLLELIHEAIPGWPKVTSLVIPIVGSREHITASLVKGISRMLGEYSLEQFSSVDEKIQTLMNSYQKDKVINENELIHQVENLLKIINSMSTPFSNILIIIDELGKSLEFASQNPGQNDIGILQQLAELANRSHGKLTLITVLHQAFDRYAEALNPIQQQEWSKIQGRFESIGFLETNSEILNLLQRAITRIGNKNKLTLIEEGLVSGCSNLHLLPSELSTELGLQTLAGCLPLHPTTALLLSRLFRSFFAQNERSLFAFMSSQEPYGFQSFLISTEWQRYDPLPLYRLNNLFDYLASSFGGSLYVLNTGKRWAEVNDALERLPSDSSPIEVELIKSIGLLELFGDQQYTKASKEVLTYSIGVTSDEIEHSLSRLVKLGIIVFREFKQAYGFWQGSDINLGEEFTSAFTKIDRSTKLADYISNIKKVNPYVARRHQFSTGTLRYFEPVITDIENLQLLPDLPSINIGGGVVIIVLKKSSVTDEEIINQVITYSNQLDDVCRKRVLFLIPGDLQGLREAYEELLTWQYIKMNTPSLEGDRIARKELSLHEHMALERLNLLLTKYFDSSIAYESSHWVYDCRFLSFKSSRDLRTKFSDIFDFVYKDSPIALNELVNRNKLSSAAAAGRNSLIDKIINHYQKEDLGILGFPPEMSMYLSVIKQSGLHHQDGDDWVLGPDPLHDNLNIKPIWSGILQFLGENSEKPIGVPEIFNLLRKPPYGVKNGLLPIYLLIVLLQYKSRIAIYEENTFIPILTTAVYERLVKVPERFKVQMFPITEDYTFILNKYAKILNQELDPNRLSIISIVQPLMLTVNRLPKYAFQTLKLNEKTKLLRDAIITAKNPQILLLKTIPNNFGYSLADILENESVSDEFFSTFCSSYFEFTDCYEQLLKRIQTELFQFLFLPDDLSEARREIGDRCNLLTNWIDDLNLKAFLLRLADTKLNHRQWLESISAVLTNKPPREWSGQDEILFKINIRDAARRINNVEDIIFNESTSGLRYNQKDVHIRVGISDIQGNESKKIVRVDESEQELGEQIKLLVSQLIEGQPGKPETKVFALSKLLKQIIDEENLKSG